MGDEDAARKRRRKSDSEKLAELCRAAREKAGLRQEDLGERLGRPQSFVSNYETGERTLDFLDVRDICAALDISFEGFVRRFRMSGD